MANGYKTVVTDSQELESVTTSLSMESRFAQDTQKHPVMLESRTQYSWDKEFTAGWRPRFQQVL